MAEEIGWLWKLYIFEHNWPKKYELVSALQKMAVLHPRSKYLNQSHKKYVPGWMGGWMGVKVGLRIAYSNQK